MYKLITITGHFVGEFDNIDDAITARNEANAQQLDNEELIIVDDDGKEC